MLLVMDQHGIQDKILVRKCGKMKTINIYSLRYRSKNTYAEIKLLGIILKSSTVLTTLVYWDIEAQYRMPQPVLCVCFDRKTYCLNFEAPIFALSENRNTMKKWRVTVF